jgi:hypothetical protein
VTASTVKLDAAVPVVRCPTSHGVANAGAGMVTCRIEATGIDDLYAGL